VLRWCASVSAQAVRVSAHPAETPPPFTAKHLLRSLLLQLLLLLVLGQSLGCLLLRKQRLTRLLLQLPALRGGALLPLHLLPLLHTGIRLKLLWEAMQAASSLFCTQGIDASHSK